MKYKLSTVFIFGILATQFLYPQTVTLPNIWGNNMVLQQNTKVPVWGWAAAFTTIEIIGSWGQTATAITGKNGKWITSIQTPIAISGQAPQYTLTIKGPQNTIIYTNILIGEVWLTSGQSNMELRMNYYPDYFKNEINSANYPNIRLFMVDRNISDTLAYNCGGSWLICTPNNAANYSAVTYFFGRELYKNLALNVPIGLINDSYGGSTIQAWMKKSVLETDTILKAKYIDGVQSISNNQKPSCLYNGMISPIIPYAIKGVLWYQGESNIEDGAVYTEANTSMINYWRKEWSSDFSFYAVQIAPYISVYRSLLDNQYNLALFREAQSNIQALPYTGIIAICDLMIDSTELRNIHPQNKIDVGKRLALWAIANDYHQSIQYLGPIFQSYLIEGNSIRIYFKFNSLGTGLKTKDGKSVSSFKIAGKDHKFYPALAKIDGNTIVVSSPNVYIPVAVRYAFSNGAMTNLMNIEGIPAYPFRTDNWADAIYVTENIISNIDTNLQKKLKIFPNPTSDGFYVNVGDEVNELSIFDLNGRKVLSKPVIKNTYINICSFSDGLYFVSIKGYKTKLVKISNQRN